MAMIATNPNHIGAQYTAIFELMVMGLQGRHGPAGTAKCDQYVGCRQQAICVPLIMDRKFKNTGSSLAVMSKDLNITMDAGPACRRSLAGRDTDCYAHH